MFTRQIESLIRKKINKGKAIIVTGPRQVGKTTLIKTILKDKDYLLLNGDDPHTKQLLTNPGIEELKNIIGKKKYVFIDEAQRIENIGITLKLITDEMKQVQLLVSGSSSFELNNITNEPLTGRKWEYRLLPLSWKEIEDERGFIKAMQQLPQRLLYGMYPDVLNNKGDEVEVLRHLSGSYLYKDILAITGIRKPDLLERLLRALALQLGNEVSYNELSQLLHTDKNTISSYINLLQKTFVIFVLESYSRNQRNEIKFGKKIYFHDVGIRNAIIGNFNPIDSRTDKGALFENFIICERKKKLEYSRSLNSSYFWRTKLQQEVDYVEDNGVKISGFEIKWLATKNVKTPTAFANTYKAKIKLVDSKNLREFIL
ncbi:MAG: ATP-binding protein [Chitinophagales bacterium]|nr:ATP-binding protein [Chitinophagales bacterium]